MAKHTDVCTKELLQFQLSAEIERGDGNPFETSYLIELQARIGSDHRSAAALAEAAREQGLISAEDFGEIETILRIRRITDRALQKLRSQR